MTGCIADAGGGISTSPHHASITGQNKQQHVHRTMTMTAHYHRQHHQDLDYFVLPVAAAATATQHTTFPVKVMTYNTLSSLLARSANPQAAAADVAFPARLAKFVDSIAVRQPDVVCLQEIEEMDAPSFDRELAALGYRGIYCCKRFTTTNNRDAPRYKGAKMGNAVYWLSDQFQCLDSRVIELRHAHTALPTQTARHVFAADCSRLPQVAVVVLLRVREGSSTVMIASTHIACKYKQPHLQLFQVHYLATQLALLRHHWARQHTVGSGRGIGGGGEEGGGRQVEEVKEAMSVQQWGECSTPTVPSESLVLPLVVAGDFNVTPNSPVYRYLATGSILCECEALSTATGLSADYGQLTHSLQLTSAYAATGGEPEVTNFVPCFHGVLDYIWYSRQQQGEEDYSHPPTISTTTAPGGAGFFAPMSPARHASSPCSFHSLKMGGNYHSEEGGRGGETFSPTQLTSSADGCVVAVGMLPPLAYLRARRCFLPCAEWPSDHLPLLAWFRFPSATLTPTLISHTRFSPTALTIQQSSPSSEPALPHCFDPLFESYHATDGGVALSDHSDDREEEDGDQEGGAGEGEGREGEGEGMPALVPDCSDSDGDGEEEEEDEELESVGQRRVCQAAIEEVIERFQLFDDDLADAAFVDLFAPFWLENERGNEEEEEEEKEKKEENEGKDSVVPPACNPVALVFCAGLSQEHAEGREGLCSRLLTDYPDVFCTTIADDSDETTTATEAAVARRIALVDAQGQQGVLRGNKRKQPTAGPTFLQVDYCPSTFTATKDACPQQLGAESEMQQVFDFNICQKRGQFDRAYVFVVRFLSRFVTDECRAHLLASLAPAPEPRPPVVSRRKKPAVNAKRETGQTEDSSRQQEGGGGGGGGGGKRRGQVLEGNTDPPVPVEPLYHTLNWRSSV